MLSEFDLPESERQSHILAHEAGVYALLKEVVLEKVHYIDLMMINKFKKAFLEDDSGNKFVSSLALSFPLSLLLILSLTSRLGCPVIWEADSDLIKPYKKAKIRSEILVDLFSILRVEEEYDVVCFFKPHLENGEVIILIPCHLPLFLLLFSLCNSFLLVSFSYFHIHLALFSIL